MVFSFFVLCLRVRLDVPYTYDMGPVNKVNVVSCILAKRGGLE